MSDIGATFVSEKFQKFLKMNDIVHKTTNVHMSSTNNLAEGWFSRFKLEPNSLKPNIKTRI